MTTVSFRLELKKLIAEFNTNSAWNSSEEGIQSLFTLDLLKYLGWEKSNLTINQGPDVKTGKRPDILLKDDFGNTIMVIESKDASKPDMLDGKYQNKTFVEQLSGYSKAEGIWWGILTNFVEWRVYSIYQQRIYEDKKYAFHDLLWQNADKSKYVDILSDEGLAFLLQLSKINLIKTQGRWHSSTIYYPQQEEIKQDFFLKLKGWRSTLRSYFRKQYGEKYTIYEIDLMTQKILDRLIFIDYCADRGIISQNKLSASLHSKSSKWKELQRIFAEMGDKFNSELFSKNECDSLDIDDGNLSTIVTELSAIDFKCISVHIIGEVYENYLAEMLRKVRSGIGVSENTKSLKKKSQGIYYTPDYIVNHIVENTLGSVLSKCKSVEQLSKVRVLDPACGSGSFLIKIFDEFRKHYLRLSNNNESLFEFDIRKSILQNNIFGVDLDERAVEIAKLNLMIKTLEGIGWQDIKGRKLLPNLKLNIRCGNSLISSYSPIDSSDLFFSDQANIVKSLCSLRLQFHRSVDEAKKEYIYNEIQVNEETANRQFDKNLMHTFKDLSSIRPFNYETCFPDVFADGGFDVIVGNPPWGADLSFSEIAFLVKKHEQLKIKNKDSYFYFFLRSFELIKNGGLIGFIIPNTWLLINSAASFRGFLLDYNIHEIADYGDGVFQDAIVESSVLVVEKSKKKIQNCIVRRYKKGKSILDTKVDKSSWLEDNYNRINLENDSDFTSILRKMKKVSEPFSENCEIIFGIKPYQVGHGTPPQTREMVDDRIYHSASQKNNTWKPLLVGSNVSRYSIDYAEEQFIKYGKWLMYPSNETKILRDKILLRRTSDNLKAAIDINKYYPQNSIFIITTSKYDLRYLLALLNSKLFNYVYKHMCPQVGKIFAEVKPSIVKDLPICIDCNKTSVIDKVDEIIKLTKTPSTRTKNAVKTETIIREIDKIVYSLYGIDNKEIAQIELI